jgi:formylglycine-generating enzyme required for sulfatase activity
MCKILIAIAIFLTTQLAVPSIVTAQESPPENHSYRGDLNEDGKVNIFDLLEMLKLMRSEPEDERQRQLANTDGDPTAKVDIFDLLGILKIASGKQEPELINWGIPITMVHIPGGTFQMGSDRGEEREQPVHTVIISPFQMSAHEITNMQFADFLNRAVAEGEIKSGGYYRVVANTGNYKDSVYMDIPSPTYQTYQPGLEYDYVRQRWVTMPGYEDHPVVFVSWCGAKAFADKFGFDLPTEAEWEYAARGGRQYEFATDDGTIDSTKANYHASLIGHSVPVESYPANPFGLFDMSGNVFEWCNDRFDFDAESWQYSSADSVVDPTGLTRGNMRIYRGGSWSDEPKQLGPPYYFSRTSSRMFNKPNYPHMPNVGFRVVYREPEG